MRKILCYLIAGLLSACAGGQHQKEVSITDVGGNLLIRDIGSDSQMPMEGGTYRAAATLPLGGVPTPIDLAAQGRGLFSGSNVRIQNVSGDIIIERAFTGMQNVDLPAALEKVFIPSENPFGETEITHEETIEEE